MRRPRFELVRSDAAQPWHARFRASNGKILWTTEQYTRRIAAETAVCWLGRGEWHRGHLVWLTMPGRLNNVLIEVREVDERDHA